MISVWQNSPFRVKIAVLVAVLLAFIVFTGGSYNRLVSRVRDLGVAQTTDKMLQSYREELKDVVDIMALSLAPAILGKTDEHDIYEVFSRSIKTVRFFSDGSGYFFIYKVGGTVFAHAAQPQLEGKNLIKFKDPEGKLLIEELDLVSRQGGGYVEYVWEKPGQGLQPKLSYARMIPDSEYWIGTGVYIDDIREKKAQILQGIHDYTTQFQYRLYAILGLAFLVVVMPLSWLVVRSIATPILTLTKVADEYSLGNLQLNIPALQRKDEIGKLALAIERMGISIKIAIERLNNQERKKAQSTRAGAGAAGTPPPQRR
jgi:methyl-accepting chemotaxis protein